MVLGTLLGLTIHVLYNLPFAPESLIFSIASILRFISLVPLASVTTL